MKRSFGITLILIVIVSCKPVSNLYVSNVTDKDVLHEGTVIYALPQTVLDVSVVAEEVTIIPGPYAKFADKYLGIHQVPVKSEKVYSLKSLRLTHHLEADPDYVFTIKGTPEPQKIPGLSGLISDSLIILSSDFSTNQSFFYNYLSASTIPDFTDLSIKRNFEAEKDVEVSQVMPDTNYISKPAGRNVLKEKSLEQKAEEAANFLIKLKKRRFKLVGGQYDSMPEGEALSTALQELARLEQEYLSLFIGKRIVNEVKGMYHYTPAAGKYSDRIVLFRFSPQEGLVNAREAAGIPVMLELEASHKTRDLENFRIPLKPAVNTIPYRIADQVNLKLIVGEQVWAEALYPVCQLGVNVTMNIGGQIH